MRLAFASLVPEAMFDVGGSRDLAAGDDALWVLNREAGAVSRIDPQTNKITQTIVVGPGVCAGLAADFGAVLVPQCGKKSIARIDVRTNAATDPIPTALSEGARSFATGVGSVWVISDAKGTITRIDPLEKTAVALIDTAPGAIALAFGGDALWVASGSGNLVTRINPFTNVIVETIAVPNHPRDIATGGGAVWTWNQGDGSVSRIDPKTNTIAATIRIGAPVGTDARIAFGEGSVWVAGAALPLVRIDPRTNQVVQIFTGAGSPTLAVAHGSVWLDGSAKSVWRLDPKRIEATR
jgi:streptogramin lyase